MKREKGSMSFPTFKRIIDNNYNILQRLWLYYLGEPLLAKDLAKMISYAHNHNIRIKINTNATLLDEEMSYALIDSGLDIISFSFEGYDKEFYETVREGADLESTFKNIKKFIEIRNRLKEKTLTYLEIIDFGITGEKLKKNIKSLSSRLGVDRISIVPLHRWPTKENIWDEKDFIRDDNRSRRYQHCIMPWVMLGILWDGRVTACCDDFEGNFIVGDVNQTPHIMDIWNNKKMVYLRKSLINKDFQSIPTCKYCEKLFTTSFSYPVKEYVKRELCELKNKIWNGRTK